MRRLCLVLAAALLLVGCAAQPPVTAPDVVAVVAVDPQQCVTRAECSTKLSRTLLFAFDYAAVGAPLVQRDGRLLFTPADAPVSDWPAVYIRLAEAERSQFAFNAQCRGQACRMSVTDLLQVYRSYLLGRPCPFMVNGEPCMVP
jgi:hypothetical protein